MTTLQSSAETEQLIRYWKSATIDTNDALAVNPIGMLNSSIHQHARSEQEIAARTLILPCKHSYDHKVSCGFVCTMTKECNCADS